MDEFDPDTDSALLKLAQNVLIAANAITPIGAMSSDDAAGTNVRSLTEAVMGITAGLVQIAGAINRLADVAERAE